MLPITERRGEVLELALKGLKREEIGAKLFISPETVRWHLRVSKCLQRAPHNRQQINWSGRTYPKSSGRWNGLTKRDRQVAELAAEGIANPEICKRLTMRENTLRWHLKTIHDVLATGGDRILIKQGLMNLDQQVPR